MKRVHIVVSVAAVVMTAAIVAAGCVLFWREGAPHELAVESSVAVCGNVSSVSGLTDGPVSADFDAELADMPYITISLPDSSDISLSAETGSWFWNYTDENGETVYTDRRLPMPIDRDDLPQISLNSPAPLTVTLSGTPSCWTLHRWDASQKLCGEGGEPVYEDLKGETNSFTVEDCAPEQVYELTGYYGKKGFVTIGFETVKTK